jgi:hypothetical protein
MRHLHRLELAAFTDAMKRIAEDAESSAPLARREPTSVTKLIDVTTTCVVQAGPPA